MDKKQSHISPFPRWFFYIRVDFGACELLFARLFSSATACLGFPARLVVLLILDEP